ncbi:hypothetical protein [Streptomyces phaeochromogenes]
MNTTGLSAARTGSLRVQTLDPREREIVLRIAQGGNRAAVVGDLGLDTKQFGHRLRKIADKLCSPTAIRSGLVYRALVFGQVEADLLETSVRFRKKREYEVLWGVAQGRTLSRIAEDLRVEEWDLGPIALQMRHTLKADDYAHAVWRGWQLQLIGPDNPGITASETRSSAQVNAEGWRRRPRVLRNTSVQSRSTTPPSIRVPPHSGPGLVCPPRSNP